MLVIWLLKLRNGPLFEKGAGAQVLPEDKIDRSDRVIDDKLWRKTKRTFLTSQKPLLSYISFNIQLPITFLQTTHGK